MKSQEIYIPKPHSSFQQQQQHQAEYQPQQQHQAAFQTYAPPPPALHNQPYHHVNSNGVSVVVLSNHDDVEVKPSESDRMIDELLDIKIRHAFIRKVYGILTGMLLVAFGLALMFNLWDAAALWIVKNFWVAIISIVVAFTLIIVLSCFPQLARRHPLNFFILLAITLCFGLLLGYSTARVSTYAFTMAAGITTIIAFGLSIFACQTKWDFTGCGTFVFVSALLLLLTGILFSFIRNRVVHIVFAALGAALFSFYMVYDTQQIVGGKHRKYQYSIDDYIFGALTLFLDIINLFLFILSIFSLTDQ